MKQRKDETLKKTFKTEGWKSCLRPINQLINQQINQSSKQYINQHINRSYISINYLINSSINRSINRSINQQTNQSANAINQSILVIIVVLYILSLLRWLMFFYIDIYKSSSIKIWFVPWTNSFYKQSIYPAIWSYIKMIKWQSGFMTTYLKRN